jgi:hypothetical protein
MTEEDLTECRQVIYNLIQMENRSEPLPVPVQLSSTGKSKLPKKEEQYRIMFAELEHFLSCHTHTERHIKVLDCLLEVRNKPPSDKKALLMKAKLEEESARKSSTAEFNASKDGVMRSTTESPMSPTTTKPPASSKLITGKARKPMFGDGKSLLEIVTTGTQRENSLKHVPFHGMRNLGEQAKLYLNLEQKGKEMAESMDVDG